MKVEFFEDENGHCPVTEFLDKLDTKMRIKTLRSIQFLENLGTALRMPISQALDDGIFELRAQSGNNITRVLYFFVIGDCAILTHGFIKKTQKTPSREIEKAKEIRKAYFNRRKGGI